MKKIILCTIFLSVLLAAHAHAWVLRTHLGITVTTSSPTILQYEKTWGLKWEDIDWAKIDEIYLTLQEAYHSYPNPARLRIQINAWTTLCNKFPWNFDNPDGWRKMLTNQGCVTAMFPSGNVIVITLGNDTGQGECAWGNTALDYELGHWFLQWLKDPCWYWEFKGSCPSHYIYLDGCD